MKKPDDIKSMPRIASMVEYLRHLTNDHDVLETKELWKMDREAMDKIHEQIHDKQELDYLKVRFFIVLDELAKHASTNAGMCTRCSDEEGYAMYANCWAAQLREKLE